MWRIWTKGFGPRYWWYHFSTYQFPNFVVDRLPSSIVYWAFIRVHAHTGAAPGDEFIRAAKAWNPDGR